MLLRRDVVKALTVLLLSALFVGAVSAEPVLSFAATTEGQDNLASSYEGLTVADVQFPGVKNEHDLQEFGSRGPARGTTVGS